MSIQTFTSEQLFDGVYLWFLANNWILKVDVAKPDLTQREAAQHALILALEDRDSFERLPDSARDLACHFLLSFMTALQGPMKARVWHIETGDQVEPVSFLQAFQLAVRQEISRVASTQGPMQ